MNENTDERDELEVELPVTARVDDADFEDAADEELEDDDTLSPEFQERLDALRAEFGEDNVKDLLADVEFNDKAAEVILDAERQIRALSNQYGNKIRFYMHREPNDDMYVLRSLALQEWKTPWLELLRPGADLDKYGNDVLQACMVYPSFDQTDWEYKGAPLLNAPQFFTKSRLLATFFQFEFASDKDYKYDFKVEDVDNAVTVAKRKKPSL